MEWEVDDEGMVNEERKRKRRFKGIIEGIIVDDKLGEEGGLLRTNQEKRDKKKEMRQKKNLTF